MASERSSRPPEPARPSSHVDPSGFYETAQHYVGDLVYGANDGILTTFAVVAGVTGGALSATTVVIVGMAHLLADGLSMGVGNYLGIRARESALERQRRPEEEARPARHGFATFSAFVVAGAVPLVPYLVPAADERFFLALMLGIRRAVRRRSRAVVRDREPVVGQRPGDDRAPAAKPTGAPAPTTALPQFVRSRYWSSSLSVPRMKNVSGSIVTS